MVDVLGVIPAREESSLKERGLGPYREDDSLRPLFAQRLRRCCRFDEVSKGLLLAFVPFLGKARLPIREY